MTGRVERRAKERKLEMPEFGKSVATAIQAPSCVCSAQNAPSPDRCGDITAERSEDRV